MSDDDYGVPDDDGLLDIAAEGMFAMFVALVRAGFSENQALKLVAMSLSTSGMADGMPGLSNMGDDE